MCVTLALNLCPSVEARSQNMQTRFDITDVSEINVGLLEDELLVFEDISTYISHEMLHEMLCSQAKSILIYTFCFVIHFVLSSFVTVRVFIKVI